MLFFRQLQHLLPDALAWRTVTEKTLRRYLEGLSGAWANARDFIDAVHEDRLPESTRELVTWERQFGLLSLGPESARRQHLAAAWRAQGGQSPRYLQDVMQAAGFDVYVHEWWEPGTMPRVKRDPRDYTNRPHFGTSQCTAPWLEQPVCTPRDPLFGPQPMCDRWLVNDPKYLVNLNLTPTAPPFIPADPGTWPYFVYFAGPTFPEPASVPAARRSEFERMLLKLCPAHLWIVTIVNYE